MPPTQPRVHVLRQERDEQDQQRAPEESGGDEELQRIVKIRGQRVVVARMLGLQSLRQTHQQRERHLDEREEQQPDGGEEE